MRKLTLALIYLAFFELFGFSVCAAQFHIWSYARMAAAYNEVIALATRASGQSLSKNVGWAQLRPHPYFGYVKDWEDKSAIDAGAVNNYGFDSAYAFPYTKAKDDFVIGIFGGSYAYFLGNYDRQSHAIERALKSLIPELRTKRIVVLNFALGAYAQPQQFAIASYFLGSFDFLLNIDGFNEIYGANESRFPIDFPAFSDTFFSIGYSGLLALGSRIYSAVVRGHIAKFISHTPFRFSFFSFAVWKVVDSALDQLLTSVNDSPKGPTKIFRGLNDKLSAMRADRWSRYIELMSASARAYNTAALFVVQPNQHVPDTKPLSIEEKEKFIDPKIQSVIPLGYAELLKRLGGLRKKNVPIYDMTNVYKTHSETIYVDNCCHVNDHGYDILIESLAPLIRKSLRLEEDGRL